MGSAPMLVPDGHELRVARRALEPCVWRMVGGLLVASTGAGGDDQPAEVAAMMDALDEQVRPCPVVMNARGMRLEDTCAPAPVPRERVASAAVVCFQKGSLAGFSDDELARVAARLAALAKRTRLFVTIDVAHDVLAMVPALARAGIEARLNRDDGVFAVEMHRPDGVIVTGVVAQPMGREVPTVSDSATTGVLLRSPRLRTLVLAVARDADAAAKPALEAYVVARRSPLLLIATPGADGKFGLAPRSLGGKEGFVAYGDEPSLHRAAREMGIAPDSYGMAPMLPSQLFAWASSIDMPVVLCAFDVDKGTVWNVMIGPANQQRLMARMR